MAADRRTCDVHRDITTTDDHDIHAGEIRIAIITDGTKHLNRRNHALGILALDTDLTVGMCTDGYIHRIILTTKLSDGNVAADRDIGLRFEPCELQALDLAIQDLTWETIGRNTIAQHTAELLPLLKHGNLMAHDAEIVGTAETARTTADDSHPLAGRRHSLRRRDGVLMLDREALQSTDVDRIIYERTTAANLTRMLTDEAAGRRHRVILTDQLHRILITLLMNEGNVAWDVHMCRALPYTWHRLAMHALAAAMLDMLHIVIAEAAQSLEHHTCRLGTDRTVRRHIDTLCRVLQHLQGKHVRRTIQYLSDQRFQLAEADTAWCTLTAGLGMAEMQK